MSIDMPKFYNKYCDEKGFVNIPTSKFDVPLNKYVYTADGRKILEGVALGHLLHAYKTVAGIEDSKKTNWHIPKPVYFEPISIDFLPLWEKIAILRNDAAHSRSVDVDSFKSIKNHFITFQKKYLPEFYAIKKSLGF